MLGLFNKKVKKGVGIVSLACFLCMPISYTVSASTAAAAALEQSQYTLTSVGANTYSSDDRWDKDRDKDRKRPPRHERDDDRWGKDDNRPPRDDNWEKDRNQDDDKDKKRPPRNDRYDKDKKKDKDKKDDDGYSKGDITTAVLIGGVIGAIIAKNT